MLSFSGSNTYDPTSWSCPSISCRFALLMTSLAQIISTRVNDDCPAKHALRANQFNELVADGALGVALTVSLEVA